MDEGRSSIQKVLNAPGVKGKKVTTLNPKPSAAAAAATATATATALVRAVISSSKNNKCSNNDNDAFYVLDLAAMLGLFNRWTSSLPGVRPYYAVKCNPDAALVGALAALGAGFDCASRSEIAAVLALGVPPDRVVYANPCKAESHVEFAAAAGVNLTTFDSREEILKISRLHPRCEVLLRIKPPDDGEARCPLGSKYGALPEEVEPLLKAARAAKLSVVGVAFHVGSAVARLEAYGAAVAAARAAFEAAERLGMPRMQVLDIGGGFTADGMFEEAAEVIRSAVRSYFGDVPGLKVIAEPGRCFAETPFTLATNVIGKRTRGELREYWINDGVFGSFSRVLFEQGTLTALPLLLSRGSGSATWEAEEEDTWREGEAHTSTVFGPTLDAVDVVLRGHVLPELHVGDWLVFPNMGAYAAAVGTTFNGFATSAIGTHLAYSSGPLPL